MQSHHFQAPPLLPATTTSFTSLLPKIELHAHLTGSISPHTLHTIWSRRKLLDPTLPLPDPLTILSPTSSFDIKTFFPLFSSYIYSLVNTKSAVIETTNSVLRDFRDDGVVYLELRTTPRDIEGLGGKEGYVSTVLDCIDAFNLSFSSSSSSSAGANGGMGMKTYLILSIDRRNTLAEANSCVDLAIEFRDRGVVGVDLCGDPSKGDIAIFRDVFARAKEVALRVTVHFAEIQKEGGEEEMKEMLSWRPDRVGHICHPTDAIRWEVLDRGVGLELCVSCNVLAGLTEGGVNGHHFGWWWEAGARVALCTDDVGVFGSPLSNEYRVVGEAYGLSKQDLIRLAGMPIECIFGSEAERQSLYEIFDEFEST